MSEKLVLSLCMDREGCLWVGTDGGGLNRVKRQVFEVLEESRAFPVQSVCEDEQKGLWFGISYGLNNGGVGYLKDGVLQQFTNTQALANSFVRTVFVDKEQKVWVGTGGGLFQLRDGKFLEALRLQVSAIHQDCRGLLWVGTQGGLACRDANNWKVFTTRDGLSANDVRAIADDAEGNLWVGTDGGGLNRLRDGQFTSFSKTNGLPSNNVFSLYADSAGSLVGGNLRRPGPIPGRQMDPLFQEQGTDQQQRRLPAGRRAGLPVDWLQRGTHARAQEGAE